jgi:hypothetical protein
VVLGNANSAAFSVDRIEQNPRINSGWPCQSLLGRIRACRLEEVKEVREHLMRDMQLDVFTARGLKEDGDDVTARRGLDRAKLPNPKLG